MSWLFQHAIYPLTAAVARRHCRRLRTGLVAAARDGINGQRRLMQEFCRIHASSEFGREHRLDRVRDWADFRAALPVRAYESFRPWVNRVLEGDYRALLGENETPIMFAKTSGTTAAPKYIPVTARFVNHYRRGWNIFGGCVIDDHPQSYLRHIIQLSSPQDEEITACGLPAGAISGLLATLQKWIIRSHYPAPLVAQYIHDSRDKYYVTMRMAIGKDPAFLTTANPSTTLQLARIIDERSPQLIRDVRDGTVDPALDLPSDVRKACRRRLQPQPELARRLENLKNTQGRLAPKDYWRLDFLCNWTGGTLGLYLRDFPAWYGSTPVRDIGLLASEARITIPLEDGTASGVLDILNNVFEFIPEQEYGSAAPTVLLPHELADRQRYFVVVTNPAGLFRYDLGDLVECTGRVGDTPRLEFLSRGKYTASLTGEKLTEHQMVQAVGGAARANGRDVSLFVAAPVWGDPPCYRVSMEESEPGTREGQSAGGSRQSGEAGLLAPLIEENLQQLNVEYADKRKSGRLGPVQVRLLPANALQNLDAKLLADRGGRGEQFKHRYLYSRPGEEDEALARLARA